MLNNFANDNSAYHDCAIQGSCSIDPILYSLMEIMFYELKQITYYIVKMQELGYVNHSLNDKILNYLSMIIVGYEFSRKEFETILKDINTEKNNVQKIFIKICEEKNLDCQILKSPVKFEKFDFSTIVTEGEKQALLRNRTLSSETRNLSEIILQLIKSASMRLIELKSYKDNCDKEERAILKLFNSLNFTSISDQKLIKKINDFAKINYDIHQKLLKTKENAYGKIKLRKISCDIKKGPAILASGQNLKEFELMLNAVEGSDINVYTHDSLVIAHSFPKFAEYKNLAGHWQKSLDNFQLDFESFKGAILITKNSQHKFDRLLRGRIFTTNIISGKGMKKIVKYDFKPLMDAAHAAEGFAKDEKQKCIVVGYDEEKIMEKVDDIIEKIKNKEIKNLFIVGLMNHSLVASEYFKDIVENIPDDSYVISTAIKSKKENVFHIDSFFNTSLIYKILNRLKKQINLEEFPVTVFLTRCNLHTISHLFSLRHLGIKNIYLPVCSADIVTPNMINFLADKFGFLKITGNPKKDLQNVIQ